MGPTCPHISLSSSSLVFFFLFLFCPLRPSAATAGGDGSDNEDSGGGSRKKLRLFKDQAAKQKAVLARQLNLKSQQVPGGGVVPEQEGENEAEADEEGGPALGRTVDFGPFCMAQDAVSDSN
uniref:Uncharacterized protein n=1 Tax=Oryza barthii TaxID=65489 RepID=A0A0D3HA21_9ORYZ